MIRQPALMCWPASAGVFGVLPPGGCPHCLACDVEVCSTAHGVCVNAQCRSSLAVLEHSASLYIAVSLWQDVCGVRSSAHLAKSLALLALHPFQPLQPAPTPTCPAKLLVQPVNISKHVDCTNSISTATPSMLIPIISSIPPIPLLPTSSSIPYIDAFSM